MMFAAVRTIHQLYNPGTLGMVNIIRFARRFFRLRSNSTWISSLRAARSQGCFNKPRRQKDIQGTQDHRGIHQKYVFLFFMILFPVDANIYPHYVSSIDMDYSHHPQKFHVSIIQYLSLIVFDMMTSPKGDSKVLCGTRGPVLLLLW